MEPLGMNQRLRRQHSWDQLQPESLFGKLLSRIRLKPEPDIVFTARSAGIRLNCNP